MEVIAVRPSSWLIVLVTIAIFVGAEYHVYLYLLDQLDQAKEQKLTISWSPAGLVVSSRSPHLLRAKSVSSLTELESGDTIILRPSSPWGPSFGQVIKVDPQKGVYIKARRGRTWIDLSDISGKVYESPLP